MEKVNYLEEILPFWKSLLQSEKEELVQNSSIAQYDQGEIVHVKNAECTGILIVINGAFRSYIAAPSGREITLFKLYERDICMLSAACVFSNITYDINLCAIEEAKAIIIESTTFKALAQKNSAVLEFLLYITQSKLSDVMYTLEQAIFFPLDYRIAQFLYEQSLISETNDLELIHEMIANHLGSSREVVSRILKKFEKEGLVTLTRGHIKIKDSGQLLDKIKKG
ncbi:Crp/Fnr family transcriptional regulator [Cellulosilyticum ruminicola]|uniref:Crp/Fnr family transcriptional regulator n=1 Tax=Cellulosilyticum ruminicola TaxID=425254 RepID=UPI0006CF33BD|nr:Crp/Fnr family transcriptional regulator [Cellulosilyticum ruminicola]